MITKAYVQFFQGLEKNNYKEWFHEHKKDYEQHVKEPFLQLLSRIIPELKELESGISDNPKDALFRINRDIRFSKDKSPYNTLMKAGFSAGGKRSFLPGFYLGIGAHQLHMGGGLFNVKPPEVKKIRDLIANNIDEFNSIVQSSDFIHHFGSLKGEQAKRLDKSHQAVQDQTPYIANKQFFAMADTDLKPYLSSDKIDQEVMRYFRMIHPLNNFLQRAFE